MHWLGCLLLVVSFSTVAESIDRIDISVKLKALPETPAWDIKLPSYFVYALDQLIGTWHFSIQKYATSCRDITSWADKNKEPLSDEVKAACNYAEYEPVTRVDYATAKKFCASYGGRLPTETEWVVAANTAGSAPHKCFVDVSAGDWVDISARPDEPMLWRDCAYQHLDDEQVEDLADFPNDTQMRDVDMAWPDINGTYGMLGNVWEWTSTELNLPQMEPGIRYRVIKGGAFTNAHTPKLYDSRFTNAVKEQSKDFENVGFRCVWDLREQTHG